MAHFGRTWWGQRFIAALEQFTDPGRLGRGRSYARSGKILEYTFADGRVTARVRGSINPYFGVYKEPIYRTSVALAPIARADWSKVIGSIGARAGFITRLLLNEMPDDIEAAFGSVKLHLLPHSRREFLTSCSCPDDANPCKHIAGVTYTAWHPPWIGTRWSCSSCAGCRAPSSAASSRPRRWDGSWPRSWSRTRSRSSPRRRTTPPPTAKRRTRHSGTRSSGRGRAGRQRWIRQLGRAFRRCWSRRAATIQPSGTGMVRSSGPWRNSMSACAPGLHTGDRRVANHCVGYAKFRIEER